MAAGGLRGACGAGTIRRHPPSAGLLPPLGPATSTRQVGGAPMGCGGAARPREGLGPARREDAGSAVGEWPRSGRNLKKPTPGEATAGRRRRAGLGGPIEAASVSAMWQMWSKRSREQKVFP